MKTVLTLALIVAISPLNSFGESRGGAGPGGGNPSHVQSHANQQKSKYTTAMIAAEREQKVKETQEALEVQKRQAFKDLEVHIKKVNLYLHLFEMMNYPFSAEFKRVVDRTKVAMRLASIGDIVSGSFKNFSIDDSIKLNGKPITFLSTSDLQDPSKGKLAMNAKLFYQQEQILTHWSVIATVFHEALRLQDVEASDSYPYSTEFALALRDAFENPNFSLAMSKTVFAGCSYSIVEYGELGAEAYTVYLKRRRDVSQPDARLLRLLAADLDTCGIRVPGL